MLFLEKWTISALNISVRLKLEALVTRLTQSCFQSDGIEILCYLAELLACRIACQLARQLARQLAISMSKGMSTLMPNQLLNQLSIASYS